MSSPSVFEFEAQQIRTVMFGEEPWFVLADVCAALGLSNPSVTAARIDPDALSQAEVIDAVGRTQTARIINESGLYEVAIRSDKPNALRFRRWITGDVLPSIRRTGSYAVPETREQLLARAVLEASEAIKEKDQHIAELTPRAEAWDELASADGDYEVADAAKILARAGVETGRQRLFSQLHDLGWIYRGSQGKWTAKQTAVDSGYLREKPQSHHHPRTGEVVLDPPQVRVTMRGIERLRVRLGVLTAVETTPARLAVVS